MILMLNKSCVFICIVALCKIMHGLLRLILKYKAELILIDLFYNHILINYFKP